MEEPESESLPKLQLEVGLGLMTEGPEDCFYPVAAGGCLPAGNTSGGNLSV